MLKANKKGTGAECRKIINFMNNKNSLLSLPRSVFVIATAVMSLILLRLPLLMLLMTLLVLSHFRWPFVDDSSWT